MKFFHMIVFLSSFAFSSQTLAEQVKPKCLKQFCLGGIGLSEKKMLEMMGSSNRHGDKQRGYFCYKSIINSITNYSRFESVETINGLQIVTVDVSKYPLCKKSEEYKTSALLSTKEGIAINSPGISFKKIYPMLSSVHWTPIQLTRVFFSMNS